MTVKSNHSLMIIKFNGYLLQESDNLAVKQLSNGTLN